MLNDNSSDMIQAEIELTVINVQEIIRGETVYTSVRGSTQDMGRGSV